MRRVLGFLDRPISWIYTQWIWGPRCSEFEVECCTCRKWAAHDELFKS